MKLNWKLVNKPILKHGTENADYVLRLLGLVRFVKCAVPTTSYGFVGSNAVVEIKYPFVAQSTVSAVDAVEKQLLQYCSLINNKVVLKHDHAYYFQIMRQLHISQREICCFIVYTSNWIYVEKADLNISTLKTISVLLKIWTKNNT